MFKDKLKILDNPELFRIRQDKYNQFIGVIHLQYQLIHRVFNGRNIIGYLLKPINQVKNQSNSANTVYLLVTYNRFLRLQADGIIENIQYNKNLRRCEISGKSFNDIPRIQLKYLKTIGKLINNGQDREVYEFIGNLENIEDADEVYNKHYITSRTSNHAKAMVYIQKQKLVGEQSLPLKLKLSQNDKVTIVDVDKTVEVLNIPSFVTGFFQDIVIDKDNQYKRFDGWCVGAKFKTINWDVNPKTRYSLLGAFAGLKTDGTLTINLSNKVKATNLQRMFLEDNGITEIAGLENIDTQEAKRLDWAFCGCQRLENLDNLQNWDTQNIEQMVGTFCRCKSLQTLDSIRNWNTQKLADISYLFCRSSIQEFEFLENWNVLNVRKISSTFSFVKIDSLTSPEDAGDEDDGDDKDVIDLHSIQNWNIQNVEDMSFCFFYMSNLENLNFLRNWDLSKVSNINGAFAGCSSLYDISALKGKQFPLVREFNQVFASCNSLRDLQSLRDLDTSKFRQLDGTFDECRLENLDDLRNWDVSHVKDMSSCFARNRRLQNLEGIANWDVRNVEKLDLTFSRCESLIILKGLQKWKTRKLKSMRGTFNSCKNLMSCLEIKNWYTQKVENFQRTFFGCEQLENLNFLKFWNVENVQNVSEMFTGCKRISNINGLQYWDIHKVLGKIYTFAIFSDTPFQNNRPRIYWIDGDEG